MTDNLDPWTNEPAVTDPRSNPPPVPRPSDGPPVTAPAPAEVPASLPPLPAISYGEAESRMKELWGNKDWIARYMDSDPEAIRQHAQVYDGLNRAPPAPNDSHDAAADIIQKLAPTTSLELLDHVRRDVPVTPLERELIKESRDLLFANPVWRQKYADGDFQARKEYAAIVAGLMRPVRDDPTRR